MSEPSTSTLATGGYVNGGDFLLSIGTKCAGHCTEHSLTFTAETQSIKVKAAATVTTEGRGKWESKTVKGLSFSGSAKGYIFDEEGECTIDDLRAAWKAGKPVSATGFRRKSKSTPYLVGDVIITKLEENYPEGEEATYSFDFENSGEPTTFNA